MIITYDCIDACSTNVFEGCTIKVDLRIVCWGWRPSDLWGCVGDRLSRGSVVSLHENLESLFGIRDHLWDRIVFVLCSYLVSSMPDCPHHHRQLLHIFPVLLSLKYKVWYGGDIPWRAEVDLEYWSPNLWDGWALPKGVKHVLSFSIAVVTVVWLNDSSLHQTCFHL